MALTDLLKSIYRAVGPELEINEANKIVNIRDKYFFSNITEAYYVLRGYRIRRV